MDAGAVVALLDTLDIIVENNPDHFQERLILNNLEPVERALHLAPLMAANAANQEIQHSIDTFLDSPAMRIYVDRYTNVTPDHIRRALNGIPYTVVDSPGDIARAYHRAVPIRDDLRRWVALLAERIDLDRVRASAQHWLPPGTSVQPEMYLVFDANAGSYTAQSKGFYNLYSDVIQDLPRGQPPDLDGMEAMEAVIAHEMQHVMTEPLFAAARRRHSSWQGQRMDQVIRGLVSEGAASHCNPPDGLRRELWEDSRTLAALVSDLNQTFVALQEERMDEAAFQQWFGATFHDRARELMVQNLKARYPQDQVEILMRKHASERPDLIHALGWHMVATISGRGEDPEAVHRLLQAPYTLLSLYTAALGDSHPDLRIDPRLIRD